LEEVSNELTKKEDAPDDVPRKDEADIVRTSPVLPRPSNPAQEGGAKRKAANGRTGALSSMFSPVLVQVFTLTFLAEWGDRSQITTIILGAQKNPYAVAVGGVLGHAICTGGAVIGGRLLAQQISVRTVTLVGGVTFLAFGLLSLYSGPSL
jgi:putative Ca2+/H+ antiporter (TMEM165/GDT1 family)